MKGGTKDRTLWNTRHRKARRRMSIKYPSNLLSFRDVGSKSRKARVTKNKVLEFRKQKEVVNGIKCFGDIYIETILLHTYCLWSKALYHLSLQYSRRLKDEYPGQNSQWCD